MGKRCVWVPPGGKTQGGQSHDQPGGAPEDTAGALWLTHNKDGQQLRHEPQRVPADCKGEGSELQNARSALPWHPGHPAALTTSDLTTPHAGGPLPSPRPRPPQSSSLGHGAWQPPSLALPTSWCPRTFGLAVREVQLQQLAHQVLGGRGTGQAPGTAPCLPQTPWAPSSACWRAPLPGRGTGQ